MKVHACLNSRLYVRCEKQAKVNPVPLGAGLGEVILYFGVAISSYYCFDNYSISRIILFFSYLCGAIIDH